ncbi:MAG: hypothetical protein ACREQL_00050 [Candidatus Binatia bacterium]
MAAERPGTIQAPAPTAAPLITAAGVTLLVAGLVTNAVVSATGLVLFVAGAVGWFREVLPHEHEEELPLERPTTRVVPSPHAVLHLVAGEARHRARLPVEVYPYSAGIKGGIAGGIAMAALAVVHGLLAHRSPWYTVNLLAAAGSATLSNAPVETLAQFSGEGLVLALVIHAVLSLLVGLLYGALLPMFPWHPAFWGGLVAPLMWTGLIAAALEVINPALNARIEWGWFVATQIAFGLVAGLVVARSSRIATFQHAPLAVRAGIETQDER